MMFALVLTVACSCNKDDNDTNEDNRVSLGVGDMSSNTYKNITMNELNTMIDNDDNFLLFVYSPTCGGCMMFKPILENAIKTRNLIVYAITYSSISTDHELKSLRYTPSIVLYENGEIAYQTDPDKNQEYFVNNDGFLSFLDEYTRMPTMYYISKDQLIAKIENDENFIVYYSRNDCGDCAYMYKNYLKLFLYNNPGAKKIYVIETNVEGIRLTNGEYNATQWQAFKDQFGLSENGNATFGYGVGYVPTIQYYNNGNIADMVVYFNDDMSATTNPDGSTTVTINGSYYSDNPYIGQSMLYSEYKDTLAPFFNSKLTSFINDYLGLVD